MSVTLSVQKIYYKGASLNFNNMSVRGGDVAAGTGPTPNL